MSGVWGLAQLVAVGAVLCTAGSVVATTLVYPRLRSWLQRLSPGRRSTAIFFFAMSPALAPLIVTAVAMVPPLFAGLFSVSDHCVAHHDGHAHICPVHLPADAAPQLGWVVLAVAVVVLALRVVPVVGRGLTHLAAIRRLHRSITGNDGDVVWFDDPRPLAFTVGWLQPRTLVSTAVRRQLSASGIEILLAHEAAHRRRRDPLQRALVEFVSTLLPRRTRQLLVADWHLAAEQSCDAAAAKDSGDSVEVARTILTMERAAQHGLGVAFGGSTLEARVQLMLAEPRTEERRRSLAAAVGLATAVLLGASPAIHHGLETLLEALLG